MCALKPPFDASNIAALALKISEGKYDPIPNQYSADMSKLINMLLEHEPFKRPNINEVLEFPLVKQRIQNLLNEDIRNSEFSHTILHKKNVIKDMHLNNIHVVTHEEITLPKVQPDLQPKRNPGNDKRIKTAPQKSKTHQPYRDNNHLRNPLPNFRANHFERPHIYKRSKTPYPFPKDTEICDDIFPQDRVGPKSLQSLTDKKTPKRGYKRSKTPHLDAAKRSGQIQPDEIDPYSKTPKILEKIPNLEILRPDSAKKGSRATPSSLHTKNKDSKGGKSNGTSNKIKNPTPDLHVSAKKYQLIS